ncbi:hypothetical protein GF339_19885 [candidate division KSB3 bacterium]|uniref:Methylenetetrahydrofolate reductase n=1 Tax=candidate division KSB3 bacterium TaxID=2044937 RepID=A0A9D5JZF1_9BACT|nr:hypothetical protein [candidate division KSB3 bacterium]MBD3326855.1 hypothetical protein [candidate division KSB3 bacterium]
MPQNYLRQALESGEFICTAELVLGRDYTFPEVEQFIKDASETPDGIKVISLTDLPGGNPAFPPECFASFVVEHGLSPLVHLTSKDGNRGLLEGRLHSLGRLGSENVLILTGDAPTTGFYGKPKPVYDFGSAHCIRLAAEMQKGISYQVGKRSMQTTPINFLIGAVVNPFKIVEPGLMTQLYKLELKIRCGAQFIIPQLGYNLRKLYELKQYMDQHGLGHIPILANVYVPTATIARFMQAGEIPGCVISDQFIEALQQEKKPQRLERAALMVAAAKGLGFAGAHVGGFGLTHKDFMQIIASAEEIGDQWRGRIDELVFDMGADDFYLFPKGADGLSDASQPPQIPGIHPKGSLASKGFGLIHSLVVAERSPFGKYFQWRMKRLREKYDEDWERGLSYHMLDMADIVKRATLGCVECGDCTQDYMNFSGCSMGKCIKETRNGPCGGSRVDGTCEVKPEMQCVWNASYSDLVAAGKDPQKFAYTLIPPRNWDLNRTNSLANYFAEVDNNHSRKTIDLPTTETEKE